MTGKSHDERRNFVRIDDYIHVDIVPFEGGGETGFAGGGQTEHIPGQGQTGDMLNIINAKLDFLIRYIFLKESEGFKFPRRQRVNLSGSGLMLNTVECLEQDSLVRVMMILPQMPPVVIATTGKIIRSVRAEEAGEAFNTALTFENIEESDRDAIIRFSFQRQLKERSRHRK